MFLWKSTNQLFKDTPSMNLEPLKNDSIFERFWAPKKYMFDPIDSTKTSCRFQMGLLVVIGMISASWLTHSGPRCVYCSSS